MHLVKKFLLTLNKMYGREQKVETSVNIPVKIVSTESSKIPVISHRVVSRVGNKYKLQMYYYFLKQLAKGIKKNSNIVSFYKDKDTGFVLQVFKENFPVALLDLKKYFIDNQYYELAKTCDDLIRKHNVNIVIEESK